MYLRNRKRVACVYCLIMHAPRGECWENTREACKTRGVADCFTHFSNHGKRIGNFPKTLLESRIDNFPKTLVLVSWAKKNNTQVMVKDQIYKR